MPRLLPLALALALAACADDTPPLDPAPGPPADAPMTYEDSAAVVQARIDSLNALIEQDQARIEEGRRNLDSLRGRVDAAAEGVEDIRRRSGALDAELGGQ